MRFVLMALTALAPGREYAVGGSRLAKLEGISQDGRGRFRLALRDEAPNIASNPPFQGRSGSLNEHGAPLAGGAVPLQVPWVATTSRRSEPPGLSAPARSRTPRAALRSATCTPHPE